jgi:hypothetical protein
MVLKTFYVPNLSSTNFWCHIVHIHLHRLFVFTQEVHDILIICNIINIIYFVKLLNLPPLGGTAILPEYIHYYGYYYQVIVQC